ncbi:MAG TPA: amino acid adenylation domain-containing protein, partial [Propionibacteriaceae bacterium]
MTAVQLLIEEWVSRQPGTCAVRDAATRRELTYRELWWHSGHLAGRLQDLGVRPGDIVGVAMPRSVDLPVALLGILRAGAAYLALDAHAPVDRVALMLDEAAVRVVLETTPTGTPSIDPSPLPDGILRLSVATTTPATPDLIDPDSAPVGVDDDSPAYIAYTSGSTGRPKGVVVPHRGVVQLATAPDCCPIAPGDRVANSSNPAFDATTFEVWSTLTAGGTLVVLPTVTDLPLHTWVDLIRAERITSMLLTTSLFHMVARERPDAFRTVGTLIVGGEQLDLTAARRVLTEAPPRRLVNAYGPTEATVMATCFVCTLDSLAGWERAPIGYALEQARLHVVDEHLRPVRPGEPGELCVAGPGVALGYLNRSELTSERFVAEPADGGGPTGTMYCTGDLVRCLPNGALEMLGRRDRQVKLRGFRIELDEIEQAAVATGLVEAAFVDKVGDGPSATLVAFVLPSAPTSPDLAATLTAALTRRLPSYMIPPAWNVLAELPVGPTGKTDRAALPAHVVARPTPSPGNWRQFGDSEPPTPLSVASFRSGLGHLWSEILGRSEIPDDASFLELGGNSILAVQLAARVRERWGLELEPGAVFRAGSVVDLANRVLPVAGGDDGEDVILPTVGPTPLSLAQERLWFFHQLFPDSAEYNVPVVLRVRGPFDPRCWQRALTTRVERHPILRSHVTTVAGNPLLVADPAQPVAVTAHDLTAVDAGDEDIDELLAAVTEAPFDLAAGPLLRADLVRISAEDHVLALTFPHLIIDGWSVGVLLGEIDRCYAAYAVGDRPDLPTLPLQYADFAAWQRQSARGPLLDGHVAFWRDRLRDVPPLQLPPDGPRPIGRTGPERGVPFTFPRPVAQGVLRLSRQYGVTPYAVLMAGFQVLLARHTGQRDVAVAVPMAGRTRRDTADLVGFFVNTQVIRSDLSGNPRFVDLLAQTQDDLLEGLAHQEAPFERVVEELHPDRDLRRQPLAQVLFGARDPLPDFAASGLSVERYPWGQGSAGFDLTVEVEVASDGISGRVDFPAGLFEDASIDLLLRHFQTLLAAAVTDPQTRLEDLALESEVERQQQLAEGTGVRRPVPDRLLHELLSDAAASWPDATAIEGDDGPLSYGRLEAWADEIAARLRARGVQPGTVVAVLLPRGPELVATLLGILRVGAAYLPLDLGQPPARLALMLADAHVGFAVTDAPTAPRLAELPVQLIRVDGLV